MPFISVAGRQIHYKFNQQSAALPALILVHGAGGFCGSWPEAWLGDEGAFATYPLYRIDLPGHGQSPPPACKTIGEYAEIVANFAEALRLEKYVVVGHSMGAAIALQVAIDQPANLAGAVTIAGGATMPVSKAILNGLRDNFASTVGLINKFSWGNSAEANQKAAIEQQMLATGSPVLHADFAACAGFDVRGKLGGVNRPMLIIAGNNDKMMPLRFSELLVNSIPQSKLILFEKSSHFIHFEHPHRVAAIIARYLETV